MTQSIQNTDFWGGTFVPDQSASVRVREVFAESGITSSSELARAFRVYKETLTSELLGQRPATKAAAADRASNFEKFFKNVVYFAAKNPHIVGETGGISFEHARHISGAVGEEMNNLGPQAVDFKASPIGLETLKVVASTWLKTCSASKNLSSSSGVITKTSVDTSAGYKIQYYPGDILRYLREIQALYDNLPIKIDESLKARLTALNITVGRMNSVQGHLQVITPIATFAIHDNILTPKFIRRDQRPVFNQNNEIVPFPSNVIALTAAAMRTILTSALEMAVATGMVVKKIVSPPPTDDETTLAPRKITYEVLSGSPFYHLIQKAKEIKRYFNSTGVKDVQIRNDMEPVPTGSQPRYNIYSDIYWKSIDLQDNGNLLCKNASLVVELESRLRLGDINCKAACGPAPEARPNARKIKTPVFTSFMKNPRELTELYIAAQKTTSKTWDEFTASTKVRKETAANLKKIYEEDANRDFVMFVNILGAFSGFVVKVCGLVTLVHLVRAAGESVASASMSAAVIKSATKKTGTGLKL
jgi:hypothetical protein